MTAHVEKRAMRRELLARRLALPPDERLRASLAAAARVRELLPPAGGLVMAYAPTKGEVDPMPLVREVWRGGRPVAFPAVCGDRIVPRLVWNETELLPGAFGVLEPTGDRQAVEPAALALVLVPAVAYDLQGFRLGYGGGYYDRFLPELGPQAVTVGLAYDELIVPALPVEPHDRPVRWVVTGTRRLGPFAAGVGGV